MTLASPTRNIMPPLGGVIFLVLLILIGCSSGKDDFSQPSIGPTSHYSFDEPDGDQVRNDQFDGLHGTIFGASRVPGRTGNALDFSLLDGAHVLFDICCYADPVTGEGGITVTFPDNSLTIAVWLKPTAMSDNTVYPIFGGWYGSAQSMKLRINNGAVEFLLYPPNNLDAVTLVTSSGVLTNDTWTHVAVTYDGSHSVLYFDGAEEAISDLILPVADISNDYFIGGIPTSQSSGPGVHSFPGVIDEFLMSNRTFSPSEVQQLFSGMTP